MTLPVTAEPLPASYSFGKVVGRIIHLIADTSADADDKPEARAATGKVRFTPDRTLNKTVEADYPAIVLRSTEAVPLNAEGRIVDAEGRDGIWLAVGVYRVQFEITGAPGAIPDFTIAVTSDDTDADPLDLAREIPYVPPTGQAVQTIVVPAGGSTGQMLVRTNSGGLEWRTVVLADQPEVITTSDRINDSTDVGRAVLTAVTPLAARQALGAASQQDVDDALAAFDTTVESTDITDSTATGRALITAASQAAARSAIGAGTGNSNLALGTTSSTAKAGDYKPTAADITDATATGRSVLQAADQAAARSAIGAGTGNSNLALGTTSTTAKAGNYAPAAADISDATTVGRNVLKAATAAAGRTALGAGVVDSSDSTVLNVVKLTQTAYNALATKVATTLYVIVG